MSKAHAAPRCTAKSKRTGERCKAPAVNGWAVCRVHGAGGGAPRGKAHWNWKHGERSSEAVELRRMVNALARVAVRRCGKRLALAGYRHRNTCSPE